MLNIGQTALSIMLAPFDASGVMIFRAHRTISHIWFPLSHSLAYCTSYRDLGYARGQSKVMGVMYCCALSWS